MIEERKIALEWIQRVIAEPVKTENKEDGTIHYLKPIPEHGGRVLRVVTNPGNPVRVITLFFDRRERRYL